MEKESKNKEDEQKMRTEVEKKKGREETSKERNGEQGKEREIENRKVITKRKWKENQIRNARNK
jgi:hypothetical protein